jgi:4-hydroxybenzoate polyprenyltransferase
MKLLEGKVAIITGASRGIGRGVAKVFAEHGAHVAFTYSASASAAQELEAELTAFGLFFDPAGLPRFLFIVAITIPFDIRDLFQDKQNELKTIPVIIGEKKSLGLCQFFLASHLFLLYAFIGKLDANFWALALSVFISGWLIFKSRWEKNEYYYFLLLDGTMILQLFMLELFNIAT